MNQELHDELVRMGEAENQVRRDIVHGPAGASDLSALELWDRKLALDARHAIRFQEIVAVHGWPGRSNAGEDGAFVAWMLAQHCWRHGLQAGYLKLLDAAVAAGDAPAVHAAQLRDTVRLCNGDDPLLGPRLEWRDGVRVELPVSDEERAAIDIRRQAVGLSTLEEQRRMSSPDDGSRHPCPFTAEECRRRLQAYTDLYAPDGTT